MIDLVITGGKVVLSTTTSELDVGIQGKEIAALSKAGTLVSQAKRVIDATGLYVLPGAIDPHTHTSHESYGHPAHGFSVASIAAAYGGTTTFIDYNTTLRSAPAMTVLESLQQPRAEADGKVAIDYSLHAVLWHENIQQIDPPERFIEEIGPVIDYGVPSFKVFMLSGRAKLDDGLLFGLLRETAQRGGIVTVHAENASLANYFTNKLLAEGKTGAEYLSQGRPSIVEAEAIRRVAFFVKETGGAAYIVHVSSAEGLRAVAEAKAVGLPIYCETCPHYLAFTDGVYKGDRAIEYVVFPPIRSLHDQSALWNGIIDGTIDCIGTDNLTRYLWAKKEESKGKAFNKMRGSFGQIETRLAYMYSEGVTTGRITVNRLVELTSTNAAKIFGLYPRKGIIAVGSDADIVLLDPQAKKKVTSPELHMGLDFTIFEGCVFTGLPIMTISKGKIIIEEGQYSGSLSDGEFLKRKIEKEFCKGGR